MPITMSIFCITGSLHAVLTTRLHISNQQSYCHFKICNTQLSLSGHQDWSRITFQHGSANPSPAHFIGEEIG